MENRTPCGRVKKPLPAPAGYTLPVHIGGVPGETRTPTVSRQPLRLVCLPFHHRHIFRNLAAPTRLELVLPV